MKYHLLTTLLVVCFASVWAQDAVPHERAAGRRKPFRNAAKTAVAHPAEEDYDIKYVKLDVAMTNTSVALSGSVTTRAVTRVPMSQYLFELHNQVVVDSVQINGITASITNSMMVRTVDMGSTLPAGTAFTAQVWYHIDPAAVGSSLNGILSSTAGAVPIWTTSTISEPYDSKHWWPCKQSLQDKIDSCDIWITVPDTLKAASNGVLKAVTPLSGGRARYEWKTRYPMAYYLLFISVSRYTDYSYYHHFPGSNDSMLVQNYLYDAPGVLAAAIPKIDTILQTLDYYSQLFGRYPFWREKYGNCMVNYAGMEHQTMSAIHDFNDLVPVHEMMHQWFGDYVTCATWKDVWLNEGFGYYGDYLALAQFRGAGSARAFMNGIHTDPAFGVTAYPSGAVYVDDTTDPGRIFDYRLTYNKGASVVHMLRYLAPSDSVFFASVRAYLQRFAFGTATTDSFKAAVQPFYTRNLDTFFNEWIYGQGYPIYTARWDTRNGRAFLALSQQGSWPQSVPFFHYPVEVQFQGPQGDTTIVVQMDSSFKALSFNWAKPVTSIAVDPADWIPNRISSRARDTTLGTFHINKQSLSIAPNPTQTAWQLSGAASGHWEVLDVSGKTILRGEITAPTEIPAYNLPVGVYHFQVLLKDGTVYTERLLRK